MTTYYGYNQVTGKTKKFYFTAEMAIIASERALKRKIGKMASGFACYALDEKGEKHFN